jgi:hypothetical protein
LCYLTRTPPALVCAADAIAPGVSVGSHDRRSGAISPSTALAFA